MDKYIMLQTFFANNSNSEKAKKMSAYMQDKFLFYGIEASRRKEIYRTFLKEEKSLATIDWDFLQKCYENEHREFQYLAVDYLNYMRKYLSYNDIDKIRIFILNKSWWDTVDELSKLLGYISLCDEKVDEIMLFWADDENLWIRRSAITYQNCKKKNTNEGLLEKIIVKNFGSGEFFINKAIGWSLRDYSKINPKWVKDFLDKYKDKMEKLSIGEAKKHLNLTD